MKKIKVVFFLTISLLILAVLNSCEYDYIIPKKVILPDSVSFKNDIIPIFDLSCNMSGCHVSGHFKVDLTPANAYADIIAKGLVNTTTPDQSKLYTKLANAGTHDGRSTAEQRALILKWIEDGAKNN